MRNFIHFYVKYCSDLILKKDRQGIRLSAGGFHRTFLLAFAETKLQQRQIRSSGLKFMKIN
jgi:hypothetical protein